MYDVFISYSRKDYAIAHKICSALDKQNISYYLDQSNSTGGGEIPAELADAIMNSRLFLFLGSRNSYNSTFCNIEVSFAFNKRRTIIPYTIDNTPLPTKFEFTFSNLNVTNIKTYPIEPHLMNDICYKLGRKYITSGQKNEDDTTEGYPFPDSWLLFFLSMIFYAATIISTIYYKGKGPWYYYGAFTFAGLFLFFLDFTMIGVKYNDKNVAFAASFGAGVCADAYLSLNIGGLLLSLHVGIIAFLLLLIPTIVISFVVKKYAS